MPSKEKFSGNTAAAVRALAEPIAGELGLSIWDVRYEKEGGLWYLRIFIDKPEGVGIDDCERMSRAINDPLDELDPIENSYCLEVSSPGINRELRTPEHFEQCLGCAVVIRLIRPDKAGEREIAGILQSYEDGVITLADEAGQERTVSKKETASVRLLEELTEVDE